MVDDQATRIEANLHMRESKGLTQSHRDARRSILFAFCDFAWDKSEHFPNRLARFNDLERPTDVALVLEPRVDAEGLAKSAEEVRHGHRPVSHLDPFLVRRADDTAAANPGPGQGDVKGLRIVVAARS